MKRELITLSGNGTIPKSFCYQSTVGEISEQIAESRLEVLHLGLETHLFSCMVK